MNLSHSKPLGRRTPTDWSHVDRWPLSAAPAPPERGVPVVLGVNWYSNFYDPVQDSNGMWWIGRGKLGEIVGGHSVCIPSAWTKDSLGWHSFYDQGFEGACVGFAASRCMSLLNRKRYDAFWLYHQAQYVDEWLGEEYEGTSVSAGMDILRFVGHVRVVDGESLAVPELSEGIAANRWSTLVEELLYVLHSSTYGRRNAVPILNSWGKDYPRKVWMPLETLQRLLDEDGEATMITDR